MGDDNGIEDGVDGFVEGAKGKHAAGVLTGNEDLERGQGPRGRAEGLSEVATNAARASGIHRVSRPAASATATRRWCPSWPSCGLHSVRPRRGGACAS